jgi:hypothetical protein
MFDFEGSECAKMKCLLKINLLHRTGIQLRRRRNYHIDNQVKKIISLNDPFLVFRVSFSEERIENETQKMKSANIRFVTDLKTLEESLKSNLCVKDSEKSKTPRSANVRSLAPQTFLLLDKIRLDAAILQFFFQQRLSETIPSQFQLKYRFPGMMMFPFGFWILFGIDSKPVADSVDTVCQAALMMCMSISFLIQLKRYRIVKNTEADFLKVTKEGLLKAKEISRQTKNMESLIREYFQLLQASSSDEVLHSHQQKIFALVLELQNLLKDVVAKT